MSEMKRERQSSTPIPGLAVRKDADPVVSPAAALRFATHVERRGGHEFEAMRFAVTAADAPEARLTAESSTGGGHSLRGEALGYFERKLGADLTEVRVHEGKAGGGRAFAEGSAIVVDGGLESTTVLAHELAHVVQQAGGSVNGGLSAAPHGVQRWDSFEHVELGEKAAGGPTSLIVLQCHDKDFPERADPTKWPPVWRIRLVGATPEQLRAATKGLTYGEIVALSGDFYGKYTDVSGAARSPFDALDNAPLWEIVQLIPLIRGRATTGQLQEATGGRYLALAQQNVSHFSNVPAGQRNIDVWRAMHRDATMLAQQAASNPTFANRAWGLNAAADHFLTDAFSAGHLRTARAALLAQGTSGQIESKVLHDLDNTYGVDVANKRGDRWTAYGDDRLNASGNATNRRFALEAVELSKSDIATAIAQGTGYVVPPASTAYPAESLVPFPVDPSRDRWTGRAPTYVAGPDGPVRVADDYTMMQNKVIRTEGPGVIGGLFNDDDQIRAWVGSADNAALGRQPVDEKFRMIETLLSGWISDDDVVAVEKICGSITSTTEMTLLRTRVEPEITSRMTSLGQRTRVRFALHRI